MDTKQAEDSPHPHVAEFYHSQSGLSQGVAQWVHPGLAAGGGAVLLGTRFHTDLILRTLREQGIDATRCEREGRLVAIDAVDMLDRLPAARSRRFADRSYLEEKLEGVLATIRSACPVDAPPIQAWGELVNILVSRGEPEAAASLEAHWNTIIERTGVRLLCSYRAARFSAAEFEALWSDIARTHGTIRRELDPRHTARCSSA